MPPKETDTAALIAIQDKIEELTKIRVDNVKKFRVLMDDISSRTHMLNQKKNLLKAKALLRETKKGELQCQEDSIHSMHLSVGEDYSSQIELQEAEIKFSRNRTACLDLGLQMFKLEKYIRDETESIKKMTEQRKALEEEVNRNHWYSMECQVELDKLKKSYEEWWGIRELHKVLKDEVVESYKATIKELQGKNTKLEQEKRDMTAEFATLKKDTATLKRGLEDLLDTVDD